MKILPVLLLTAAIAADGSAAEKPSSARTNLTSIPGIAVTTEAKLNAAGINNVNDLLLEGATPKGRKEMAARSGLPAEEIVKFVHYAELFRINGVAAHTAGLLQAAGIETVLELAKSSASHLHVKLQQAHDAKKEKGKAPTEKQVADWIEAAKALPQIVTY